MTKRGAQVVNKRIKLTNIHKNTAQNAQKANFTSKKNTKTQVVNKCYVN